MSEVISGNEKGITRRRFFLYAWAITTLGLLGEGVAILFNFLRPRVEEGTFGGQITAGKVEDFPVGSVTAFRQGQFYLAHLEGGFLALYRVCPHLGCIVPWSEEQQRFECPCHAAVFNMEGEVLAGPPPRPLDLFPVEIVEGAITVDTGTITQRSSFEESQLARP
ncbi:MAG: ubiquinol-cytochrome c reductase iron-sulfur subunit [Anaerolineae bacterium]